MTEQQAREALRLAAYARAESLYESFTPSERRLVQLGLFPAGKMQAAVNEGHDSRMLSVALMDLASKKGGK